jgi:phosphatidylserine/phosphatidylglycerophosphate/cardiolipin synthase-like enzyme/regulation of enolase protein 1 (concanavalin A-like superfamily)
VRPLDAQAPPPLAPQERLCDPAFEDCRADILTYIQQETVAIDMGYWMITDARYSNALVAAAKRGVKIRLLMDPRCAEAHPACVTQNDQLRSAGIPMRQRQESGILHWKTIIFAGQGQVEFAGTNYAPFEMVPETPFINYTDEIVFFTKDPSLVQSFMTKFDDLWTSETEFADYANVTRPLTRSFPVYPLDPELNFPPDESYRNRAVAAYDNEQQKIDAVMFRITDAGHPDALLRAVRRGVPVRLITDETEYRNPARLMDAYYVDLMHASGVTVRFDSHQGINHQKSMLMYGSGMSIIGSSNWTESSDASQREHNYFTVKPWMFEWLRAQFERKWNNGSGFAETKPFVPLPPDRPTNNAPANGATGVSVTGGALAWTAGIWAHKYDIYFGTTSNPQLLAADVQLGPSLSSDDYRSFALPALQPGTTYYWKIVAKTMANVTTAGPVSSFTTAGTAPAPTPSATVTVVRRPYLQQPADDSVAVVWATREAGPATVRYGLASTTSRTTVSATSRLVTAAETGLAFDYYQHSAKLSGLTADTTFAYQPFVNGTAAATETTFKTAPADGSGSISFIAFGDSGTGSAEQRQLADVMSRDTFDFAVHVGDIAYGNSGGTGDATYATYQSYLFDIYNWLPSKAFVPVEGNHDSRASNNNGKAYLDVFELPRNGASASFPDHAERYYSFDNGPVHFVALDTEYTFLDPVRQAEQLRWLEADLQSTTQPWTIAVLHRAPYSSGGEHGSSLDVRAAFGPLFERYGVDLVLTGHEHTYERTIPIRESANTSDSFVPYVVTGGGGAPLYPSATSTWTAFSASTYEYAKITADTCTIAFKAIGLDGSVIDSTNITRCTTPPATLPAGWTHADVGNTGVAGNATASGNTFSVTGAGADVWGTADAFHYAYRTLTGDGTIVARVASIQNVNAWTKAGVMIRNSLSPSASQAFMLVAASATKGVPFQRRPVDGGTSVSSPGSQSTAPRWVKLVRAGNSITGYESADGATWTVVGTDTFTMGSTVLVGLAVSSHVTGVNATATFDNVTITTTATPPANQAPTVSIGAPASGAHFTAPANITVTASASDSDGTIANVEFFNGTTSIGSSTGSPYSVTWSNVAAGTYTITAVATDNQSARTTSNAVTVTVDPATPPGTTLPEGWSHADVGNTGATGDAAAAGGTFSVTGAGADVWGTADAFHYAYRSLTGDGTIVARVATIDNVDAWTKAGVMIRNSLSPSAAQAFMLVAASPLKGVRYQRRLTDAGSSVNTNGSQSTAPRWVKLVRAGNVITAFESGNGTTWTQIGSDTFVMGQTVLVGLAVSSHVTGANATATFDNVSIATPSTPPPPPPSTLPAGWNKADVGNTGATGDASASGGTFTVTGAGADVWGTADAFHYAYRTLTGDGTIVARVTSIQNVNAWTKAGVMIRNSLSPSAAQAFMLVASSPLKGVPFQRRTADGAASVSSSGSQSTAPRWVKLVRAGNVITGYESADGVTWTMVGSDTFAMGQTVLIGLAVSSHVTGVNATATFDNLTVNGSQ